MSRGKQPDSKPPRMLTASRAAAGDTNVDTSSIPRFDPAHKTQFPHLMEWLQLTFFDAVAKGDKERADAAAQVYSYIHRSTQLPRSRRGLPPRLPDKETWAKWAIAHGLRE